MGKALFCVSERHRGVGPGDEVDLEVEASTAEGVDITGDIPGIAGARRLGVGDGHACAATDKGVTISVTDQLDFEGELAFVMGKRCRSISEEDAMAAVQARNYQAGEVLVIRQEGPRGGPGMREMLAPTSAIAAR